MSADSCSCFFGPPNLVGLGHLLVHWLVLVFWGRGFGVFRALPFGAQVQNKGAVAHQLEDSSLHFLAARVWL